MWLTEMVEVDDARVEALTPEAFRLVLEARGWVVEGDFATLVNADGTVSDSAQLSKAVVCGHSDSPIRSLARYHGGSTYGAFIEVERVQKLLTGIASVERGSRAAPAGFARLWIAGLLLACGADAVPHEARAQLPRLVRIICGVEASR